MILFELESDPAGAARVLLESLKPAQVVFGEGRKQSLATHPPSRHPPRRQNQRQAEYADFVEDLRKIEAVNASG